MATHLVDEILMEILVRLPVRSLCKFKCVSKYWRTLISDSYFKMMHLNRGKNDPNSQKLLVSQWFPQDERIFIHCLNLLPSSAAQPVGNVRGLDFPSIYRPCRVYLACCFDGLAVMVINDNIDVRRNRYLLWNPSTGE
ncbi:putative F-box protein CPR30-like isoform 2 [Capsicum annuum]|uniref:F-box domain-containing protein n=1 Tax=Capsicum annuum TaxID=4072 RepID=A0A2G2Y545_CAPAN|nr:putative F-box protein CPR30-like isoform 2 [Capsicum annuum]KAF3674054.1 putative F-box protein CPR30-like isoform 2 [Capsicum annuum]PHT64893.1 hypothetical protein T459_29318 [Capsicum annuum]